MTMHALFEPVDQLVSLGFRFPLIAEGSLITDSDGDLISKHLPREGECAARLAARATVDALNQAWTARKTTTAAYQAGFVSAEG